MSAAACIFAKTPRPGFVKTRLVPPLTNDEAADVARACLEETLGRFPAAVRVPWTLHLDGPLEPWIERAAEAWGVAVREQGPGGLGARLERAFHDHRERGASRVVAIGSDSPTLDPRWVADAIDRLETDDVVLGPARDGGYYLIGVRGATCDLFESISWSTGRVLEETRERVERAGRTLTLLPPWYDLDTVPDLKRAAEDAADCPCLSRVLATIDGAPG